MLILPKLNFAKFRFTLEAIETLYLPEYKGSTLRGGFGHAFRKVVCNMGAILCETCLLHLKCPYPQFFEAPIEGDFPPFMRGVKTGPQPFVLEPPLEPKRIYQKGESLEFALVLVGRAIDYLPYFIYTFDQLGRIGIGRGKGRFRLTRVENLAKDWQPIYDGASKTLTADYVIMTSNSFESETVHVSQVTLNFQTPTRIKFKGHLSTEINFREFVLALLRRVCILAHFHMPEATVKWDWRAALDAANELALEQENLHWVDWERYSNRQKTRMKLGGFVGQVTFRGDLTGWMPLLKLGEFLHVGKGATFGLGKYEVD